MSRPGQKMKKKSVAGAFLAALACLPTPTFAQQLPTDIDLRAAYCLPIVNDELATFQTPIDPSVLTPQMKQGVESAIAEAQERANRLKRFLLPRVPYLDATALLAASTQGKQDEQRGLQDTRECFTSCQGASDSRACMTSCETDALARVRRCSKLDWLPF